MIKVEDLKVKIDGNHEVLVRELIHVMYSMEQVGINVKRVCEHYGEGRFDNALKLDKRFSVIRKGGEFQ